jgi:hypothetical protein
MISTDGPFIMPVRERHELAGAIRTKIVREIAGVGVPSSSVQPVQGVALTDCDANESLWDDFAPEPHAPVIGFGREL